jgi:hypothetical protein
MSPSDIAIIIATIVVCPITLIIAIVLFTKAYRARRKL